MHLAGDELPSLCCSHPRVSGPVLRLQLMTEVVLALEVVMRRDRGVTMEAHLEGGDLDRTRDAFRKRRNLLQQVGLRLTSAILAEIECVVIKIAIPHARITGSD